MVNTRRKAGMRAFKEGCKKAVKKGKFRKGVSAYLGRKVSPSAPPVKNYQDEMKHPDAKLWDRNYGNAFAPVRRSAGARKPVSGKKARSGKSRRRVRTRQGIKAGTRTGSRAQIHNKAIFRELGRLRAGKGKLSKKAMKALYQQAKRNVEGGRTTKKSKKSKKAPKRKPSKRTTKRATATKTTKRQRAAKRKKAAKKRMTTYHGPYRSAKAGKAALAQKRKARKAQKARAKRGTTKAAAQGMDAMFARANMSKYRRKKPRSAAQKAATKRMLAANKRRR